MDENRPRDCLHNCDNERFGSSRTGIDERKCNIKVLSDIPAEVYKRGADDIQSYFKSVGGATEYTQFRKRLCVVGQSTWGKTSLIKRLTTDVATTEAEDNRTMGVDIYSWSFESYSRPTPSLPDQYDVSVWDFAGQDEYQSMHTLFYSKRTMYVMCINLKSLCRRVVGTWNQ